MADYAAHPTSAKQDQQIIDLRKRMLAVFLNRCRRMELVRNDGVWQRFLDPNASWVCTVSRAPCVMLIREIERGIELSSNLIDPEECSESPATGYGQPYCRTSLPSRPRVFR